MQRTKALGLLHKTIRTNASMCRQGIPDYLVTMRTPGDVVDRVAHGTDLPVDEWQKLASPYGWILTRLTRCNTLAQGIMTTSATFARCSKLLDAESVCGLYRGMLSFLRLPGLAQKASRQFRWGANSSALNLKPAISIRRQRIWLAPIPALRTCLLRWPDALLQPSHRRFHKDTSRLNDRQCMTYLRLIWLYYDQESPLKTTCRFFPLSLEE